MKFISPRAAAGVAMLLGGALYLSSCTTSPEVKAARFIENGKKQLTSKKDPRRAILEFQNAIKIAPQNAEAYFQLANAYLASGDGTQAGLALPLVQKAAHALRDIASFDSAGVAGQS